MLRSLKIGPILVTILKWFVTIEEILFYYKNYH